MSPIINCQKSEIAKQVREMRANPFEGLRKIQTGLRLIEGSVNDQRYRFIALTVGMLHTISASPNKKAKFLKLMKVDRPSAKVDECQLLLLLFRYVLCAPKKGALYERARIYAAAMGDAVVRKVPPELIPELIREANGVEELYARCRIKINNAINNEGDSEDASLGGSAGSQVVGGEPTEGGVAGNAANPRSSRSARNVATRNGSPAKRESPKAQSVTFSADTDLVVAFPTSKHLNDFLGAGGDRGSIGFEIVRMENAPVRVLALSWKVS